MSASESTQCDASGAKEQSPPSVRDSSSDGGSCEELILFDNSVLNNESEHIPNKNGTVFEIQTHGSDTSNSEHSVQSEKCSDENTKSQMDTFHVPSNNLEMEIDKEEMTEDSSQHLVENDHSKERVSSHSDEVFENIELKAVSDPVTDQSLHMASNLNETRSTEQLNVQPPNGIYESLFSHPAYKTVIQELAHFKEKISLLQADITRLEGENQRLEADRSHEIYVVQLETLEKTIGQQQRELQKLSEQSRQQAELTAKNYSQMRQDLESKLERLTKQYEVANKERESMVMRYAISEKEVIDQKKEREILDKKLKESLKERDLLMGKLKGLTSEKTRICQIFDNKVHELTATQKENERLKEELNSREIKIKWAQNKLRTEMDMHKETQAKLDRVIQKLQESREETELVRRECQESIRSFQESQENKAYTLGLQLKEQQAKLIMERHGREDKEENHRQLQQDVENLKRKHQVIIEENNVLSVKVQNLEKERLEYEQNLSNLKRTMDKQRQSMVDLQSQLAEMESLRIHNQHEHEKLLARQAEVERLRQSNDDLLQEMAACREREAELLDFTQKLTDKNVRLQSEFSATEAKAQQLEYEQGPLQRRLAELESELCSSSRQLEQEQQQRQEENQLLARHLAERTQRVQVLTQELEDQQGMNQLLRRKQVTTTKELTRELQHCRKRLEQFESSSGSNSLGHGSRASSCGSLNALSDGVQAQSNGNNGKQSAGQNASSESTSNQSQLSPPLEPDRQTLIERIVKVQRANARKQEKLEFMEEHTHQLVGELQKKTRIVQSYIMREQAGALSSETMDQNKAELTKHGGIMASLYGSKAVDNTMTLELSLEINKKLQAVLEDTLLKNITLKENIDTLGSEIARLTKQNSSSTSS